MNRSPCLFPKSMNRTSTMFVSPELTVLPLTGENTKSQCFEVKIPGVPLPLASHMGNVGCHPQTGHWEVTVRKANMSRKSSSHNGRAPLRSQHNYYNCFFNSGCPHTWNLAVLAFLSIASVMLPTLPFQGCHSELSAVETLQRSR